MVGEKLFKKFSAWFTRKSLETKLKDEEKKRVRALDALLRSKIPGFKRYEVVDRKILVTVEPEAGYGEYWNYLIFKDDHSKNVKVPSGSDCDALAGVAVACKWSDVVFPVPGSARVFYAGADFIQVFKRGDNLESLSIEGELAQGGAL